MSGHSRWSQIKRKKGKTDVQRGKLFSKILREITVAAQERRRRSQGQHAAEGGDGVGQGSEHAGGQHQARDPEGHR